MPEQKCTTLRQKREEKRLELLGSIDKCLTGDVKQTVLDFVEYCNENEMPMRGVGDFCFKGKGMAAVRFRYKGGRLGKSIVYEENSCYIDVVFEVGNPDYENFVISQNLSDIVWKNVKYCEGCLSTCAPGRDMTLLGKTLNKVCVYKTDKFLRFIDPNAESLRCIKKILEFRKGIISAGKC